LNLLIDSTEIKAEGEGEWHARKHGGAKRHLWRKIHIGADEQTLEFRAIEITGSSIVMRPCCPNCSAISPLTWRSGRSPQTGPTTWRAKIYVTPGSHDEIQRLWPGAGGDGRKNVATDQRRRIFP